MRRASRWAAAAALTIAAAHAEAPAGSLYPPTEADIAASPLARALGPAGYVLSEGATQESFAAEIRKAVGLHPVFHREITRRAELRAKKRGERAALYPRLAASLTGDYVVAREFGAGTDNVVESLRPSGQFNAGLSVAQLVFDGGATFQRIRSAKAGIREQDQTIEARVNELALGALSAFEDLAAHQAVLALGEEFIRRHQALVSQVEERERLGGGTRADVMKARARLAQARARTAGIRESLRLAEIRYVEFFRTDPAPLARPSFEAIAVGSREQAAALAAQRHPEIGAAAARADRARADWRAAKASRYPQVQARVDATKFDVFDTGNDDYDVRAGVAMQYDLFSGGARGAAIAQAREAAREQQFDEERVRQEIERDAQIAFERRESANERLAVLGEAVVANFSARDLIGERFRAARGDLIDVLQAENDYFESAVAYLAALADRDMATYGLMEHTGDLLRFFSPEREYAASAHE